MKEQLISLCGDRNRFGPTPQKYLAPGPFPVDDGIHFATGWLHLKDMSLCQTLDFPTTLTKGPLCASFIANYKVSSEVWEAKSLYRCQILSEV